MRQQPSKITKITVREFYETARKNLSIELVQGEEFMGRYIREPTVNRPGLVLAGYMEYFPWRRVQVLGSAEMHYLKTLSENQRLERYKDLLMRYKIPCLVVCRGLKPDRQMKQIAKEAGVPVFSSKMVTMHFINEATILLWDMFAPRMLIPGSTVDILGIGVLIQGESGIGKSECVLELIERGYQLVSDDVTWVKLSRERKLIASSPDVTFGMMEVRGIGIIDARAMFGVRGIQTQKEINLVVTLKDWREVGEVERIGLDENYTEILGVKLRHIVIPVKPGRDLGRLVEVAAFDTKLRMLGMNAAKELDKRLIDKMQREQNR